MEFFFLYWVGSILLAAWLQPVGEVSPEDILKQFDDIAVQVATEVLKEISYDDDTSQRTAPLVEHKCPLTTVKKNNVPRSIILETMNSVIYKKLGFGPTPTTSYFNINNSFINKVKNA